MTFRKSLSLILTVATLTSSATAKEKLETRRFDVLPTFSEVAVPWQDQAALNENTFVSTADMEEANYKEFLAKLGVTWSEGSEFSYLATIGKVQITNTPDNIELVRKILILANLNPCLIEVQVDFVEYDLRDIEALTRENQIGRDPLLALWKKGKGKLLHSGKTRTKSGQECVVKGVTECIYPTEFNVLPREARGKAGRDEPIATVEPLNFEMREVGNILQCIPEISKYGNNINILLNPEHLNSPIWKDYSKTSTGKEKNKLQPPTKQPFFYRFSISSQATVANNSTLLLGGGLRNDSKGKCTYCFLSARLIDMKGNLIPHVSPHDLASPASDNPNKDNLETKYYYIVPSLMERWPETFGKQRKSATTQQLIDYWKRFHSDHGGINWPEGSDIYYFPGLNLLKIINTRDNINKFEFTDSLMGSYKENNPEQPEARIDFVEFDLNDIDRLALNNTVTYTSLKKLWKKGKGRLLSTQCVLSRNGHEAITRNTTEYIYPTEFNVKTCISTNKPDVCITSPTVQPQNSEMREVGTILQMVPEYCDQTINLLLNPQYINMPTWENFGTTLISGVLPMEQPFFSVYSISTQISIANKNSILLGGGISNNNGDKIIYSFLTANLTDPNGDHIEPPINNNNKPLPQLDAPAGLAIRIIDLPEQDYYRRSSAATELNGNDKNELSEKSPEQPPRINLRMFFEDMGIEWPKGSSAEYYPQSSKLVIISKQKQIDLIHQVMSTGPGPRNIVIQADYVEFDTDEISQLSSRKGVTEENLRELWSNRKGKLINTSVVQTKSGQEAIVKGVTEFLYPTEFETKKAKTPTGKIDVAEPQNFEMREAGNILQVVPEISAEGKFVNLLLNPQLVTESEWKQYGNGKNLNMPQPFFHSYSTSTQVTVKNGETILLGGGMNNPTGDKTVFIFLKAEIVDERGEPVTQD